MGYRHLDGSLCTPGFHRFVLSIPARMKAIEPFPADVSMRALPTTLSTADTNSWTRWPGRLLYEFPRQSHVRVIAWSSPSRVLLLSVPRGVIDQPLVSQYRAPPANNPTNYNHENDQKYS